MTFVISTHDHITCGIADKMTLRQFLPREFSSQFTDTRAFRLANVEVIKTFQTHIHTWPGRHKHVHSWCVLKSGHAVGWNENPARGWSFPVMKLKKDRSENFLK